MGRYRENSLGSTEKEDSKDIRNRPEFKEWAQRAVLHLKMELKKLLRTWLNYVFSAVIGVLCIVVALRYLPSPFSEVVISWVLATYTTIAAILLRERYQRATDRKKAKRGEALLVYQQVMRAYAVLVLNEAIMEGPDGDHRIRLLQPIRCNDLMTSRLAWETIGEDILALDYHDYVVRMLVEATHNSRRQSFSVSDVRSCRREYESAARSATDVCDKLLFELAMRDLIVERTIFSYNELSRISGEQWHRKMREYMNELTEKGKPNSSNEAESSEVM